MQLYCKSSTATSSTKKFPNSLFMNIVQVVNSSDGNFVQLSITTVFAFVLTESNKRLDISDKNTVPSVSKKVYKVNQAKLQIDNINK